MNLLDIYQGRETWEEWLRRAAPLLRGEANSRTVSEAAEGNPAIPLVMSLADAQRATDAGLGAVGFAAPESDEPQVRLEPEEKQLAGGIAPLNADFHLLLGDLIWRSEMQQEQWRDLLHEVRLAEFEREARAFRQRAERAYLHGWYEEALRDFLAAEQRNYPDFVVLRSIAQIYLYHLVNLPRAYEYFGKAAKYARPVNQGQAAEAEFLAAMVCALQQQIPQAIAHLREAIALNPELHEAQYQLACLLALNEPSAEIIPCLAAAIKGDARYYERAKMDTAFAGLRAEVEQLLAEMMEPVREMLLDVRHVAEQLDGFIIARPVGEELAESFAQVEEHLAGAMTWQTGLHVLEALRHLQQELRSLHNRYYKQYEIDPRDYVRSVAFSPDGRLLASGFLYGGLQVWQVDSGMKLFAHTAHYASIQSVAFSPNNQLLATGSRDRLIKLWDAETGRELQALKGHTSEVRAVAFSPDGQWLVSAAHDLTVRLWRVATGRQVEILRGHTMPVTAAAFSPDGRFIASGSWDKTIRLWDAMTAHVIRSMTGHTKGVASLAISPDGRLLASGGEDATVRLWEVSSGRELNCFTGHGNSVTSVAFSPDGELLAAGCLGQIVMVWKLATGEVVKRLRYQNISYNSVAFSPQGQWLALGSRDLQLWLKAILSETEYQAVREGEARALQAAQARDEKLPAFLQRPL